jgi:cobalt-precorrin-5B (C1)-methyltransferase
VQRLEHYISAGGKRLRCGYTTGTCAAAATRAAAGLLLSRALVPAVVISTPSGIEVGVDVEEHDEGPGWACCAVRKDAGDDPDVTDSVLVWARVTCTDKPGISIDGGAGVGRVTRAGLDQPVGAAAINSVPREMIARAARDATEAAGYAGGLAVEISIPAGGELATRTFNPRLGIEGGISVLGTSGIVRPMSEDALVASLKLELSVLRSAGVTHLLVVPGNYGKEFSDHMPGLDADSAVKCSNFVGEMLDHACELKVDILLVSNLGKIVKVAGGIMNTHSRNADSRMEIIAANAAMCGADLCSIQRIMDCISTDDALDVLNETDLIGPVSERLAERIEFYMNHRTGGSIRTAAVVFSSVYGLLSKTSLADEMIKELEEGA